MTEAVSDRELDRPSAQATAAEENLVNVAWGGRLVVLLFAGAGTYVAAVSLAEIWKGQAVAAWLLPLATGALAMVLCGCLVPARFAASLSLRSIGRRALAIILLILYAFVLLPVLGFLLASLIFVTAAAISYAPRPLAVGLGGAILTTALWALFVYVVSEPLPVGWLWR